MRVLIGNSTDIDLVGEFERDGAAWWAQRLVWFARDGDVVILPERPQDVYLEYVTGLTGVRADSLRVLVPPPGADGAARLTRDRLLAPDFTGQVRQAVAGRPVDAVVPLWPSGAVAAFAEGLGVPGAVAGARFMAGGGGALANSKAVFRALAEGTGVPLPQGAVCASRAAAEETMAELLGRGRAVIVKHEFYSGGVGNDIVSPYPGVRPVGAPRVTVVDGPGGAAPYLDANWDRLTSGGRHRLVVEEYVPESTAVFAEFDITDDGPQFGGTGQMFSRPIANAQALPMSGDLRAYEPEVVEHGRRLCTALHAMGYRGRLSADAVVTPDGAVLFTEYNGRITGSTHLYDVIGKRVVGPDYAGDRVLFERVGWRAPSFREAWDAVSAAGLAYRPQDRAGVVFCSAYDAANSCVWYCVVAPDLESVRKTEDALRELFPQEEPA